MWTDRKLIVAFRSFENAPKNVLSWCVDWIAYERFRVELLCSSRRPLNIVKATLGGGSGLDKLNYN
jgi:hypothetical protein